MIKHLLAALALAVATGASAAVDANKASEAELDGVIDAWTSTLAGKVGPSLSATRALLTPPERRRSIADGLAREHERFLDLIETDETEAGMARFLARSA